MIISAFTEKYSEIQKRLINQAVITINNDYLPVRAQWDTGATGTCISKEVVDKLNLKPIGKILIRTPSGQGYANSYLVNIDLNNEVRFSNLKVMDSEIGSQGIDVLIGMDIISQGDFSVSNFDNKTYFSFRLPSQGHIEYTKDNVN